MANPLPTLDHVYSLVLQGENQMEVFSNIQFPSKTSSFIVGKQERTFSKVGRQLHGGSAQFQKLSANQIFQ